MDGYSTVITTYSPTTPPAVDAVATGSCLMIPSVMPDSREPVPTSSGFAITRRGGPRNVAATRAAGEDQRKAAESKPSKTRMRLRVRPIVPGSSLAIRRLRPRRHLPTETRTGLTRISP